MEIALAAMVLVRFRNLTEVVVTYTEQVELAGKVAPESAIELPPGVALMTPLVQLVCALGTE